MSNPFLTKKDPLLESVKAAMQDGEFRRQAEALVNENFGVYSRKAVIREQLAAYDAALEEAYKCMKEGEKWEGSKEDKDEDKKLAKKHGMTMKQWEKSDADKKHDAKEKMDEAKLADKDYDKDGKVESPKDEVWGSRLRAAKMAGKMEESNKENKEKKKEHEEKTGLEHIKKVGGFLGQSLKRTARSLNKEETDYSAQDRAPVTRSAPKEDPSTPKVPYSELPKTQNRAGAVIDSAKGALKEGGVTAPKDWSEKRHPNKNAVTKAPVPGVSIAEAKYSAKAARAGADIGKPGKQFAKIAAKAGEKYGSEEKGKKVAGAILAKIRAKHMKEDSSF